MNKYNPFIQIEEREDEVALMDRDEHTLILHNDDVNTFDHVIDTLIEVCDHDPMQAEQCAWFVHYRGKCDVKHGSFEPLNELRRELNSRGLEATVE